MIGIKESARVNNLIVILKVAVVLLFIVFGVALRQPGQLEALHSAQHRHFGEFGWSGVFRGAGLIFFAYIGFDAVSTAAQEAQESAAGHADRDPRLAGHLHLALHRSSR